MKMEIALVANFPRASLSFDLTAHNNALQLNMEELKVCLSANIKIEEREEKGEVCNITYFESGQKENLEYPVIVYGFEIRYLGRTKLVENKVWDGSTQFRPWKSDICTSKESPFSFVFRLEIEGIIQRKEGNAWIKNGLLTLKIEVMVTSKSAGHLLSKQLMPDEPLSTAVSSSQQIADEVLYDEMPEEEDLMIAGKKPNKEFLKKNGEQKENTPERSKYGAENSFEDFQFNHHKLIWLLQFLIAVIIEIISVYFSVLTHPTLRVLVPILLVVSRSNGELCIPEATLEVGNITLLRPCEKCDFHKLNCEGNNISACLTIFPTTQFAVGCAPNICINDGCPEWNGGNGSYKIQYRNGECNSTCQGHFSLAEWIKNCTISQPPSIGDNCLIATTGENGSVMIASFSIVAVGIVVVVVVGLLILGKKKLLCFKNIGHGKKNEPEGERLRDI